jgi:hypothetical protein
MSDLTLRLDGLHERHPGLTQALGESYAERHPSVFRVITNRR